MAPDFVRYTADLETIAPDIEELLPQVIEFWKKKGRESPTTEGTGRAVRGAHAKSFGLVKAEVQILHNVPEAYAQGIYAKPGRHGALMRFSSSSGHLGTDAQLGPGMGCAMKIFDIDGVKLTDEDPDATTFDLVMKNNPFFLANTARHYLLTQDIVNNADKYLARGKEGFEELMGDFLTGRGTYERSDWAWDELFAFIKIATQTPVRNPVLTTFSTMAAVRHGDYVAKVRLAPARDSAARVIHPELDLNSRPDVFGPTLIDELQAGAFDFDLQVQLCADAAAMPINDSTVEWPESLSPYVTVARVHLPQQDISGPENDERGDEISFNQWRVTAEHRPMGEIMDVRRIYTTSAQVRRTLNGQRQTEPASADAVLP
jgi:hypothetical protein